jgi:subfamily B ATP-binding cassette protein HlyB/CyaB
MAVEPQMQRRWEEQLAAYVRAGFRTQTLGNIGGQAVQFVNKGTIVLTLYLGAKAVIDGDLTVGELVAFNMLAARVAAPVLRIAQLWQDFQQTRISVDRLGDILNTAREQGTRSAASLPPMQGAIRFEHVTFRYRVDGPAVLSDVSLEIREVPGTQYRIDIQAGFLATPLSSPALKPRPDGTWPPASPDRNRRQGPTRTTSGDSYSVPGTPI